MMMTSPVHSSLRCFLLCLIVLSQFSCEQQPQHQQPITLSGLTMGTTYTVKIHASKTDQDYAKITTGINHRLEKINLQMSTYMETSALSRFNQSHIKDWVEIPVELYSVIEESLRINKLSQGSFDVTVGPVINLWGFGSEEKSRKIPAPALLEEAFNNVGSKYIHLRSNPYSIKKDKQNLHIDLSAIAKGYAVDVIADYLDELGLANYMIEIGGEIKARGFNSNNKNWQIGIEKPLSDQRSVQTVISLTNTSMATSGDYRNYFEANGIRYSHTIDPNTGKPVTHKLAAVTVLHPSCMTADGLATALLVLGPDRGLELAIKENLAVLFIVREKDEFLEIMTPRFKNALVAPE